MKKIHNLYSLPDITRIIKASRMRWAGYVAYMGYTSILDGKTEGKRPLGRPSHKWMDKMDHKETRWESVD
jgi:hypothetical protein